MDRALPSHPKSVVLSLLALASSPFAWAEDDGSDEVFVVEDHLGDHRVEAPASLSVLPVDDRLSAADDVASLVGSATGTAIQRLGGLGDWSGVSIRGAGTRNTLVCLDGVPLNPDGASTVNLSELPLSLFEEVRVYRGRVPPRLGGAPMGGAVDLVTGEGAPGARGAVSMGSHTTGRMTGAVRQPGRVGTRTTDTLVLAEAFSTRGDHLHFSDNGTEYQLLDDRIAPRDNNDTAQLAAHGRWSLVGERWRLRLIDSVLSREEGLPGHIEAPTTSARLRTQRNLAVLALDGQRQRSEGELRLWALGRNETLDDRGGEIGTGNQWQTDLTRSVGMSAYGQLAARPQLATALSLSARHDRFRREDLLGEQDLSPRHRTATTTALSARWWSRDGRWVLDPVMHLGVLGGVAGGEAEASAPLWMPSPQLGLLVRPWSWFGVAGNVGWGWRPPDFTELYGDRGALIGNSELVPERGVQADLGVRLVRPATSGQVHGSLEAAVFQNHLREQIVFVQNSQRTMVPINLEDGRTRGLELAVVVALGEAVHVRGNLTRTFSTDLSDDPAVAGNQLPRVPAWDASLRNTLRPVGWLALGHTYDFVDGNYWDRTNYYRAAPRHLHGAFARVSPALEGALTVELSVLNLLDRIAEVVPRNPLDPDATALVVQPITDFVGYPLPGRTVLVTLAWAPPRPLRAKE